MLVPETFIYLRTRPSQHGYIDDVVGIVTAEGVRRLWDDRGRTEPIISREHESWLRCGAAETIIIPPDDPRYDAWWAWYTALEMGVDVEPPYGP